ncbi:hypothetical protein IAT38_002093 [Cryptococcus sp. DSM 104549]
MSLPALDPTNPIAQRPSFERVHTDAQETSKKAGSDPEIPVLNKDRLNDDTSSITIEQSKGVTKIEALYLVFGNGWKLWMLWGSIACICCAYSLSQMTTWHYTAFATSAFGTHTLLGTIATITSIMAGVAKPFIAKCADLWSRPMAIAISVALYTLGYIIVASSNTVDAVAAGEFIYTLGNTGINFVSGVLIADITSLQWRGFVNGLYSLPFVPFAFLSGDIADGINAYSSSGWRWGYGMFCIIIPVTIAPALIILFWADSRAKKLGALSLASSTYAREKILAGQTVERRPWYQTVLHYARRLDVMGLLLLGFAFAMLLSPFTLSSTAQGGYKNPSLIAMLVVGGVLFIAFCLWEWKFTAFPIMPRRVFNKTFLCSTAIDVIYFFSGSIGGTYWSSWLYVTMDYNAKDYTYMTNILTVGLCIFGACSGAVQRYIHSYKKLQLFGLALRILAMGVVYMTSIPRYHNTAAIVSGQVLISLAGGITVISTSVAAQASVPHQDMAIAQAVLSLWTSIGGSISSAISASVWNSRVPMKLEEYLGATHNATEIAEIFGSIVVARLTEPRPLVIQAYNEAIRPLYLAGLITSAAGLFFGFLTTDYYLGKTHNAIEDKEVRFRSKEETDPEVVAAKAREVEEKVAAKLGREL